MDGRKTFFLLFTTLCFIAAGLSSSEASPAANGSPLRQALRRAVRGTPPLTKEGKVAPAACNDNSQCASNPTVCADDPDLGMALCPAMCGACLCEDNVASQGNCTDLVPEICQGDFASSLCAKTCGLCGKGVDACMDHVTGISCADLPDPCNDGLGQVACPKFCGYCNDGTFPPSTAKPTTPATSAAPIGGCTNQPCLNNGVCSPAKNIYGFVCTCPTPFTGTICQTKPAATPPPTTEATTPAPSTAAAPTGVCATKPCLNNGACSLASNSFGFKCNCPAPYSGSICQTKPDTTTVATTSNPSSGGSQTTASSGSSCPNQLKDQNSMPCQEGEIIFLVEYSYKDSGNSIDHEGDFIKELVDGWRIKDSGIRFGVVIYHDTVTEAIHITDFKDDPDGLKNRITSLTRGLKNSGTADLAKALDYVRTTSFKNARPGVVKVAVPIIHQMSPNNKDNIVPAAQKLKDDCVNVVGVVVGDDSLDYDIIHNAVSAPYASYFSYHRSYYDMENAAKWVHYYYPGCHANSQTTRTDGGSNGGQQNSNNNNHPHHNNHHNND